MAIVLAGLAVGNYECYIHENEITSQLVPAKITYDNSKLSEAQMAAGNVVDQIAQEGMTLMKNDGTLPLEIDEDDEDDEDSHLDDLVQEPQGRANRFHHCISTG